MLLSRNLGLLDKNNNRSTELYSIRLNHNQTSTSSSSPIQVSMQVYLKNVEKKKRRKERLLSQLLHGFMSNDNDDDNNNNNTNNNLNTNSDVSDDYEFNDVTVLFIHGVPLDAQSTWLPLVDALERHLSQFPTKFLSDHFSRSRWSFVLPVMRGFNSTFVFTSTDNNSNNDDQLNRKRELYDMRGELSRDVQYLVDFILQKSKGRTRVLLVGHDLGSMVIHTFASQFSHLYRTTTSATGGTGEGSSSLIGIVALNSAWHYAWNELLKYDYVMRNTSDSGDGPLFDYLNRVLEGESNSVVDDDARWTTQVLQAVFHVPPASMVSPHHLKPSRFMQWYYSLFERTPSTLPPFVIRSADHETFKTPPQIPVLAIASTNDPLLPIPKHFASMVDIMRSVMYESAASKTTNSTTKFFTKLMGSTSHYLPISIPDEVARAVTQFLELQ